MSASTMPALSMLKRAVEFEGREGRHARGAESRTHGALGRENGPWYPMLWIVMTVRVAAKRRSHAYGPRTNAGRRPVCQSLQCTMSGAIASALHRGISTACWKKM
jgi:hypothetical protein